MRVDFVAPVPDNFPFFCSYQGNGAVMHGVLHVVPR
jgi:azurin